MNTNHITVLVQKHSTISLLLFLLVLVLLMVLVVVNDHVLNTVWISVYHYFVTVPLYIVPSYFHLISALATGVLIKFSVHSHC